MTQLGLQVQATPLSLFNLLVNAENSVIPEELLTQLETQFGEEIEQMVLPVLQELSLNIRRLTLLDSTLPFFKALLLLTSQKAFIKVVRCHLTASHGCAIRWLSYPIGYYLMPMESNFNGIVTWVHSFSSLACMKWYRVCSPFI